MKEIERRFLVEGNFPSEGITPVSITQGYLCSDKEHVVRVRILDNKAFLTVKGPNENNGFSHIEIEKEVSIEEGKLMLGLCEPGIVSKDRYIIPSSDGIHKFEVDVFGGKNSGLVIAEVELENEDVYVELPSWIGKEITTDYRYSNSELRKNEVGSASKKIVYVDMDGVLVDFISGVNNAEPFYRERYKKNLDLIPGVFGLMEPMPGAIEAINRLKEKYEVYILSTAPWYNPSSWMEKRQWVGKYFGEIFHKRLILTHHKELNIGDYLIDDRTRNGAAEFKGELIEFGSERFPDWNAVIEYLDK